MPDVELPVGPLRIFCIEDNPLIVLHLEMMIEDAGHRFAGSAESFASLRAEIEEIAFDLALVDIDLADGRTGGEIAAWLLARGCPSLFVTGQEQVAENYADISLGVIVKPITADLLAAKLSKIQRG